MENKIDHKFRNLLLLSAVILIWGIVLFRISASVRKEDYGEERDMETLPSPTKAGYVLKLNYEDPFLKKQKIPFVPSKKVELPGKTVQAPLEKPPFRYRGKIVKKGEVYLAFEIDGQLRLLKEDEEVEGFRIGKVAGDSVLMLKRKKRYVLHLH